jgi:hypothetical protein
MEGYKREQSECARLKENLALAELKASEISAELD